MQPMQPLKNQKNPMLPWGIVPTMMDKAPRILELYITPPKTRFDSITGLGFVKGVYHVVYLMGAAFLSDQYNYL